MCGALQNSDRLVMEKFGSRDENFVKYYRCQNCQRIPITKEELEGNLV